MPENTYIDLFAGCGGLSLGLHNAGWKGLFAIEKNPDAFLTLKHNLIDCKNHFNWPPWLAKSHHDINEVLSNHKESLEALKGKVDMIAGGPPCQGFSMAGRRNESDVRNKLVESYIEFIGYVKPKLIFFENVKGFTQEFKSNKDKGRKYVSYVENALTQIGYQVKGKLVNFGDYGIPQKRTRFILVGVRNDIISDRQGVADSFFDLVEQNKYSFLDSKGLKVETNLQEAISDIMMSNGTIPSPDSRGFKAGIYSQASSPYQKLMRANSKFSTPDSHRFVNHSKKVIDRFKFFLQEGVRNKDLSKVFRERHGIKKHTIIPLDGNQKSPTITTLPDDYIHYEEPRILTVREYARIQSFPDWYQFQGKYTTGGKLRTQEVPRYSQIGNAIPPLFGEQSGLILSKLI